MKTADIKYKMSNDYDRLYDLLKSGNIVFGTIAINIDNIPNPEYSKLTTMNYNPDAKMFDLGFSFFEMDFNKDGFKKICKRENVKFIDL